MSKKTLKTLNENQLGEVALRFRALGEVSRLLILRNLQSGEKRVTDLVALTGLSQPNVSRHLLVLSNAKVIQGRKDGLNVYYRVIDENLFVICELICNQLR